MTKKLEELSEEEFNLLRSTGLLWEIFPEAKDTYHNTRKDLK